MKAPSRFRAVGRAVVSLVFLLVLARPGAAQWQTLTFDESNPLTGVWFLNDSTGIVVGENASIFRITGGGSNHSKRSGPIGLSSSKCCHSVRFLDDNIGWIGGTASVLRTSDGGSTWGGTQINFIGGSTSYASVFGISSTVVWQVGTPRRFLRYTFSGNSISTSEWTATGPALKDLHMFDADSGFAVGTAGSIARVVGASGSNPAFTVTSSGTSNVLNSVHMVSPVVGWAVGSGGAIVKTMDGGNTWSAQSSGTINNLYDVFFKDENIGWAVGDAGLILLTLNGGTTWSPEASGTSNDLRAVHGVNNIYAVGVKGTFLKRAALGLVVTGITPDRGPTGGGTTVTISGAGFKAGLKVTFSDADAAGVTVVSSSSITATTPRHAAGSVDVVVTNTDNQSGTLAKGFLYIAPPRRRSAGH